MDINSPPAKRQRLPTSSRHVWMLSHSADKETADEYQIYFVDLDLSSSNTNTIGDVDRAGYTHIVPTFRYDGRRRPRAFCILGSTLYIFEGYRYNSSRIKYRGKSVHKFELCPTRGSTKKFEDRELESLCDMHTSKHYPHAIPTPDGKRILVFSAGFLQHDQEEAGETHFELYNPLNDSWDRLPAIASHYNLSHPHNTSVQAYSFLDEHRFYIQLRSGLFVLDLKSLEKGWDFFGDPRLGDPYVPWRYGYFPTIKNKFALLFEVIYDVTEVGLSREPVEKAKPRAVVQLSSFPDTDDIDPCESEHRSVTVVHHGIDDRVHWCALKSQSILFTEDAWDTWDTEDARSDVPFSKEDTGNTRSYARVLIDVCVTDLAKLNTKIDTSLPLLIDYNALLGCLTFVPAI